MSNNIQPPRSVLTQETREVITFIVMAFVEMLMKSFNDSPKMLETFKYVVKQGPKKQSPQLLICDLDRLVQRDSLKLFEVFKFNKLHEYYHSDSYCFAFKSDNVLSNGHEVKSFISITGPFKDPQWSATPFLIKFYLPERYQTLLDEKFYVGHWNPYSIHHILSYFISSKLFHFGSLETASIDIAEMHSEFLISPETFDSQFWAQKLVSNLFDTDKVDKIFSY